MTSFSKGRQIQSNIPCSPGSKRAVLITVYCNLQSSNVSSTSSPWRQETNCHLIGNCNRHDEPRTLDLWPLWAGPFSLSVCLLIGQLISSAVPCCEYGRGCRCWTLTLPAEHSPCGNHLRWAGNADNKPNDYLHLKWIYLFVVFFSFFTLCHRTQPPLSFIFINGFFKTFLAY